MYIVELIDKNQSQVTFHFNNDYRPLFREHLDDQCGIFYLVGPPEHSTDLIARLEQAIVSVDAEEDAKYLDGFREALAGLLDYTKRYPNGVWEVASYQYGERLPSEVRT